MSEEEMANTTAEVAAKGVEEEQVTLEVALAVEEKWVAMEKG